MNTDLNLSPSLSHLLPFLSLSLARSLSGSGSYRTFRKLARSFWTLPEASGGPRKLQEACEKPQEVSKLSYGSGGVLKLKC